MDNGKFKQQLQVLIALPLVGSLSGCNVGFDWNLGIEIPQDPAYFGLESSRPELIDMQQLETLDDFDYLAGSSVIYFAEPVFSIGNINDRVQVDRDTGEIIVTQNFSVDSGTDTLVDSAGFYSYSGPMNCELSIAMHGDWDSASQELSNIVGEISSITCDGGAGAVDRNTPNNAGNSVEFLDNQLNLGFDGSGRYIDGQVRFKYGLLDLPPGDPIGPIAFEFEATTEFVP
ncbi:Uncharacterised protein [BD1-7 clade bacterium]|uniref:Lipoprotein n=1 Tax=BD1-7 clade bacterium TaxID=2029982 RepID=A0A5S9PGI3_9GAMM|nr:Uncharacterised protein [BD1-7 clade bacterium]